LWKDEEKFKQSITTDNERLSVATDMIIVTTDSAILVLEQFWQNL
jgi:hypothetical protein